MTDAAPPSSEPFPRQEAATRRFRLGVPRSFAIAPSGDRLAFLRSNAGRDPVGNLWVAEVDGSDAIAERLVVDARGLHDPSGDVPAAERARRERMRETTDGITAFATDASVSRAVFALDGALYLVDLVDPAATPLRLDHPGPVVDPRMSPDGSAVAFVVDRSMWVVSTDPGSPARLLAQAPEAAESTSGWGVADFVAAEELGRSRGHWWTSDSSAVFVELVDEAAVDVRWIADPANPQTPPTPHRYPSAGTTNPCARLFRIGLDGTRIEIEWDHARFEYLVSVSPDHVGGAVVSVLSRDQRRQAILSVAADGSTEILRERHGAPWITVIPGVPRRLPDGRVLDVVADTATDTFRLVADDLPISPAGVQIAGVVAADDEQVIVTATTDPFDQHVYLIDSSGDLAPLTTAPGVHSAVATRFDVVLASTRPDRPGVEVTAWIGGAHGKIRNVAETPNCAPRPVFARVGARELATAVLWPSGHVPRSRLLPVVLAPYGGPHHSRVVHAAGAFVADQWLADQGFAVVVIDGAGTPGRGPAFEFEVAGDLATQVLADQVAGLHALAAIHPDLDLTRVGITGWSFGGYLAALAVLDRPDVFHAAVAGAPVTDWTLYDTAYTERYLGLPAEAADAYRRSSLLDRAADLRRPLLLVHGLADDNVLAAHTLRLSSRLLAAGRPHTVVPLSGVTHMTPQPVVAENLLHLQVAFLREHLGA